MNGQYNDKQGKKARVAFFIGSLLFITSLFLDWYYFKVYSISGDLIADWTYTISFEWTSSFKENVSINQLFRPNIIFNSLIMFIISIGTVFVCLYGLTRGMMDDSNFMDKIKPFAGVNIFLLLLNVVFIIGFPVVFFMPNNFYFPFLKLINVENSTTYFYSIGPGYIIQIISFLCIFPYSIFTLQTINKFEKAMHSPKQYVERRKREAIRPIKIDLLIEEEKNHIESSKQDVMENEGSIIYTKFKKSRSEF